MHARLLRAQRTVLGHVGGHGARVERKKEKTNGAREQSSPPTPFFFFFFGCCGPSPKWAAPPRTSATSITAAPRKRAGEHGPPSSCCRWTRSTTSWTVRGVAAREFLLLRRRPLASGRARKKKKNALVSLSPALSHASRPHYTHTHTHYRRPQCGGSVRGAGQLEPGEERGGRVSARLFLHSPGRRRPPPRPFFFSTPTSFSHLSPFRS